jgi:hypothetical protein
MNRIHKSGMRAVAAFPGQELRRLDHGRLHAAAD